MTFDHYLVTRVAVRLAASGPGPSVDWLRNRMQLFELYCAPSVNAQTEKNFTWLLFVDSGCPDWLLDRIEEVVAQRHETVLLDRSWDECDLGAVIGERSTAPVIVTSRLDSDDALGRRYVERVQAHVRVGTAPTFLNFLNGAQYAAGRLSRYAHPSNAFLSLIEPVPASAQPSTVMSVSHDIAGRDTALIQVREGPLWLQVVHGGNMLNGSSGWRAQPSEMLQHFALPEDLPDVSRRELAWSWVQDAVAIAGRIAARPSRLRWIPRYISARVRRGAATPR